MPKRDEANWNVEIEAREGCCRSMGGERERENCKARKWREIFNTKSLVQGMLNLWNR